MDGMSERPGDRLPANHPGPHRGPIGGAGAWYGPQVKDSADWAYALTAGERDEFVDAMRHALARHDNIAAVTKANFPLPRFGARLDEFRREIVHGRGFVLLRNFPVEDFEFKEIACMYWGLGCYLGSARSQNVRGHMLGHVVDITDQYDDPNNRGYLSARHLKYHSDSVDMVGLLCLRQAMAGGLSTIVSSYTIHDEMWRRRPDLAEVLYGPIARSRRKEIPEGKGPWYELPIFNYSNDRLAVSYLRQFIDDSQDIETAPRQSEALVEALDMIDALANDPALYLSMDFQPGDRGGVVVPGTTLQVPLDAI